MASGNLSPRQKMINLIYIVLLAMLAINVSSDVMSGYAVLNNGYANELEQLKISNEKFVDKISLLKNDSLDSVVADINRQSYSVVGLMDSVKVLIAKEADKDDYVAGELKNKEDMKVVPFIMLAPTKAYGKEIRNSIESLREDLLALVTDEADREIIRQYLNTEPVKNSIGTSFSWERECFTTLPAEGGIVLLNKLEISVFHAVNRAYISVLESMSSKNVYVEDEVEDKTDEHSVMGVASAAMNVMYAGVDNEVSLFCSDSVYLSADNGKVKLKDNKWFVKPYMNAEALKLSLMDSKTGKKLKSFVFRVIAVKTPEAMIVYKDDAGNERHYFGGTPISRKMIMKASGISLNNGDRIYDNKFRIMEFEMVFVQNDRNIQSLTAKGGRFTEKQIDYISKLKEGDIFYITSIMVKGNDGITRQVSPLEVIIKDN